MGTRSGALRPVCEQQVAICEVVPRKIGESPGVEAVGDALRLDFGLLFLREPDPEEGDVVVGISEQERENI